ncbi:FHA domain-containing protein [Actinocatenispora sera]|uniref:Phosphopeptide-binding protein n=1 Tax=Actinocatenispora sera TaxID=390989 RepID=A0A810L960_9ACTN|nr:FHA domain-containing protein [Actinocatenispora sera]BCJ32090.1 phosphopeptide-binding protein [Actinocatenispora sera]
MTTADQTHPLMDATSVLNLDTLAEMLGDPRADHNAAVAEALPPYLAVLLVRGGPQTGAQFLLDRDVVTAGRHPDGDIFLDDVTVSRRHAEFLRDGTRFSVRDLGSLNGTHLNDERVESAVLTHGDEIRIGKFRLAFIAPPARS